MLGGHQKTKGTHSITATVKRQGKPHSTTLTVDLSRHLRYYLPSLRAHSSVGQSHRLITGRSQVRALVGPPASLKLDIDSQLTIQT